MAKEYVLDGSKVTSLDAFYDEISKALSLPERWGRNLDALDDVLSGGDLGVPDDGFVLTWTCSDVSRAYLSHPETVRRLEQRLASCDPANRERVRDDLQEAQQCKGPTVFDWLVELIRDHGNNVTLVLA